MGAFGFVKTFDKKLTDSEINYWFKKAQKEDAARNGHQDGYSGDLQTVTGVSIRTDIILATEKEAVEYTDTHCEKWGHLVAVCFRGPRGGVKTLIGGMLAC